MSFKFFLLAIFLCACLNNGLALNLTAKEEIELHGLFTRYNKPAVKVIKTIHGDTYNCVDFYKQPAFDHPLLKNHSYLHEMTFSPMHGQTNVSQDIKIALKKLWENGEGCPVGTVPIRKYTKDQFIRTHRLFQKLYSSDGPVPGRFRASIHTKNGQNAFYGTSSALSYYNYPVDRSQYTAGYVMLRAGNDQFQYGWMINPTLYGDGNTRLFLSTKVENNKCFNTLCGTYVQLNKDFPTDSILPPATKRGADHSQEISATIIKDPASNVWKLYGTNNILYGIWPNEGLKGLTGPAEYLEWGGEAYNPNGLKGPGMGSGFFPNMFPADDGYARNLKKYNQNGRSTDVYPSETEQYADDSNLYRVTNDIKFSSDSGYIVFYGGPGK